MPLKINPLKPKADEWACNWVSVEMDYPKTKSDIEAFFFYLYHDDIEVYVDHYSDWYITAKSSCKKLVNGNCSIEKRQPEACREYGHEGGSMADVAKFHIKNEDELLKYLAKQRPALFKKLHKDTQDLLTSKKSWKQRLPKKTGKKPAGQLDQTHACTSCDLCCTYLNIVVEKPTSIENVKSILWYINHSGCKLNLDADGGWSVVFHKRCIQLDENGLCSIYNRRPYICKEFSADNCHGVDFNNSVEKYFAKEKELISWLEKKKPKLYCRLPFSIRKLK